MGRFPAYHFGIFSAILVFLVFFVFSSGFGLYCSYQVTYLQLGIIAINKVFFRRCWHCLSELQFWDPRLRNELLTGSPLDK